MDIRWATSCIMYVFEHLFLLSYKYRVFAGNNLAQCLEEVEKYVNH